MAYTTINKSTDYFNTKLYTGNGSTNAVTGVGFQPDFVWIKDRTGTNNHELNDSVRGVNHQVFSNLNNAETTPTNHLNAFNSDGFTLGNDGSVNTNSSNYCSWNWKAGTTGSGNTTGSGTYKSYNYSVNTTSGFSIVKYTGNGTAGQTIPHHLGAVPKMIMVRIRGSVNDWQVYHSAIGNTERLILNDNSDKSDQQNRWNDTSPTSSVFTLGGHSSVNANDEDYIAYVFAEKQGYSKFGSYTGNGNADGVFVYTGFKPSWLMIKRYGTTGHWHIFDIKRNPYYPTSSSYGGMATRLMANLNYADDLSQGGFEFLSNGLKMTTSWDEGNGSGNSFIYMCFGQSLVGSNNVPCTAR